MAYVDFTDDRNNIRRLQVMLRSLSRWMGEASLNVAVNGKYDERTAHAVMSFQKMNGIPQTGKVDYVTWNEIAAMYRAYDDVLGQTGCICPFPSTLGYTVRRGERSNLVLMLQIMLNELRRSYDSYGHLPQSGRFDITMENAVREFQMHHALSPTGIVDRATWNSIAEEYNAMILFNE